MSFTQPTGMTNDNGVILTIGIKDLEQRSAIVIPVCTNVTSIPLWEICNDAVVSFYTSCRTALLDCLSEDVNVSFIQGEGMRDGMVPFRIDYPNTALPGTTAGDPLPSQVAALMAFYEDPTDVAAGGKIRCAKNYLPGISEIVVVGNEVLSAQLANMQTFGDLLQQGFPTLASSGDKWYRVLASPVPRTPGTIVKRTINCVPRGYICTQKRRLIPR